METRTYEHKVGPYRYRVEDRVRNRNERDLSAVSGGVVGGRRGTNARQTKFTGINRAPRIATISSDYTTDAKVPVVYMKLTPEEIRDKRVRETMGTATIGAGIGAGAGARIFRSKERGEFGRRLGNRVFEIVGGTEADVKAKGFKPRMKRAAGTVARDFGDTLTGKIGTKGGALVGAGLGAGVGYIGYQSSKRRRQTPQYRAMYGPAADARQG